MHRLAKPAYWVTGTAGSNPALSAIRNEAHWEWASSRWRPPPAPRRTHRQDATTTADLKLNCTPETNIGSEESRENRRGRGTQVGVGQSAATIRRGASGESRV